MKTAYDLRISVWSSDLGSSGLTRVRPRTSSVGGISEALARDIGTSRCRSKGIRAAWTPPREPRRADGRSGGIRTHDPHTPSVVRYQTALRSDAADYRGTRRREQTRETAKFPNRGNHVTRPPNGDRKRTAEGKKG